MITRDDIVSLFGEQLEKIEDAKLRESVIQAWVMGCEKGGYTDVAQLHAMPFTLLTDCRGVSFVEHTIAVTEGALSLALHQMNSYKQMPYAIDLDRLVAGGLLHDVGKLLEIQHDGAGKYSKSRNGNCMRHPISGTVLAAMAGLPDEVLNMIACHAKEGEGRPQVVETVLVHLADFATFDPLVLKNNGKMIE